MLQYITFIFTLLFSLTSCQVEVTSPDTVRQEVQKTFKDGIILGVTPLFGMPEFGKTNIKGHFIYRTSASAYCKDDYLTDADKKKAKKNKDYIIVVSAGECDISQKVRIAQTGNAVGVIVVNGKENPDETLETFRDYVIMAEDSHSFDIVIPSVFIRSTDGAILYKVLKTGGIIDGALRWDTPTTKTPLVYRADFRYNLGTKSHFDFIVQLGQLLANTSSSDDDYPLFSKVGPRLKFVPHMDLMREQDKTPSPDCFDPLNKGRNLYCCFGRVPAGVFGEMAVRETLRQVCLYSIHTTAESKSTSDSVYFKYLKAWGAKCAKGWKPKGVDEIDAEPSYEPFSLECSKSVLRDLKIDETIYDQCAAENNPNESIKEDVDEFLNKELHDKGVSMFMMNGRDFPQDITPENVFKYVYGPKDVKTGGSLRSPVTTVTQDDEDVVKAIE